MTGQDNHPPLLTVGVIGVGRAGSVLGAALRRAGYPIVAAAAVSDASLLRAEALLPNVPIMSPPEVLAAAQLVLVTVPDDALPGLISGLAATGAFKPGQFIAHVSGRYGISVLDPATQAGALPLALHPAMTFTGTSIDLDRLVDTQFGVTAPDALRPIAEALVVEMTGEPVWVPEAKRALYHGALAHGANHLVTLVNQSMDLLREAGVEDPQRMLAPLLSAALDNALRQGDGALTGPVARGDAGSLAAHIAAIDEVSPEASRAYIAMARSTADRALAAGILKPAAAQALLDVLAAPMRDSNRVQPRLPPTLEPGGVHDV